MKFKNLLSLSVMLSCGLVSQAQVIQEAFDAAQTKQPTDKGYYEFINQEAGDDWKVEAAGGVKGGALSLYNADDVKNDNNTWRRAVKFRNLELQDGKMYRLTYYIKGSNTYKDANDADQKTKVRVGLMQGVENADIAINSSQADISYLNPDAFEKYTNMFYFKSKSEQDAEYEKQCSSKEAYDASNKDKYFTTFNIYNPGQFFLDEVTLEEATVASVVFNGDVICVDFGYATNAAELAASTPSGHYLLDNSAVAVKVGGKDAAVLTAELRSDGKLYIFLENEASGDVEVTFTNNNVLTSSTGYVLTSFTEKAEKNEKLNEDGNLLSDIYGEASFLSATPVNGSFALESKDLKTISVTFDREVLTQKMDDFNAPVATLSNGTKLTLKNSGDPSKTLTFEYAGADLADGTYTIKIQNITTTTGATADDLVLTYEIGKVSVGETTYNLVGSCFFPEADANTVPEGWTVMSDGEERTAGNEYTGGGRVFVGKDNGLRGIYTRANGGEGSITSPAMDIPAGDIEVRCKIAYWSNPSNILIEVVDEAGNVVESKETPTSCAAEANRNAASFKFEDYKFRFENKKAGKYTIKYTLKTEGFNGMYIGGHEAYTYKETGNQWVPEVIAEGNFASVGNDKAPAQGSGWKIYRADNRMRDPGSACGWGGEPMCWTGGGGPRVKTLGNKGMNGAGIYLGGGCYATYGEYLTQVDHAGTPIEGEGDLKESILSLGADRYQVTYYIIGWKNPGNKYNIQLDVYNQEDGIKGTPVYTRLDTVTEACGSGNDASSAATKVSFLWNAPKAGNYILKFTASGDGEGEAVVGNVSIESTASLALQYATEMQKNLEPAKEELALAQAKDEYKGATRDLLDKTIKEYSAPDFHTVTDYQSAFTNLDELVKKSAKRRQNIDGFAAALESVKGGLEAAQGTQYEGLPQFPIVSKAYNDYKDIDYIAMDDDALDAAVTVMKDNGSLLKNMVETCVPLITKQITDLAAAIVKLNPEKSENEIVLAAGNVISDDQTFAGKLKFLYAAELYKQIADGKNPFVVHDEDLNEDTESPIDCSFLMQNAKFYSTAVVPAGKENVVAQTTDFPGWNIEVVQGNINPIFTIAWGGTAGKDWPIAVSPFANCAVKTGWGSHEYDVKQLINMMPVGQYTASIKMGEDGGEHGGAYAFIGEGENQKVMDYVGNVGEDGTSTYSRDATTLMEFTDVKPTVEGNFASLTLGAHMKVAGGFGNIDDATLTMTGKLDGFDYAKAAAALDELYKTSIETTEAAPAGDPALVQYFTVDGKQTVNPQGLVIKVESWANGYVKVSKMTK